MRLLDTRTGRFVEKNPRKDEFKYAILSHTWDADGEQTYQALKKIQEEYAGECLFAAKTGSNHPTLSSIWDDVDLSPKILNVCAVARKNGYRYIWIDSCCIDKTSSSELSEAINSMYACYEGADLCFAYLADVPPDEDPQKDGSVFRRSRWFTRGWTLQELLAPGNLVFLSMDWARLGTKDELAKLVSDITDISVGAVSKRESLFQFSVAQRFSWAARRETTRVEDRAYSLLGIFEINMPTLYGEGERAFQRLQEEILQRLPDQSIFAWGNAYPCPGPQILRPTQCRTDALHTGQTPVELKDVYWKQFRATALPSTSLLAPSPDAFAHGKNIEMVPLNPLFHHYYPDLPASDYRFTPLGIRTHFPLIPLSAFLPSHTMGHVGTQSKWHLAILECEHVDSPGHLLGRVCCVHSSTSGINVLSRGAIVDISSPRGGKTSRYSHTELVVLSAEALARSSALARVDLVYISKPGSGLTNLSNLHALHRPHKMINLLLKRKNDAPGWPPPSSSSSTVCVDEPATTTTATLRWPDQDHPNTHWLTISRSPASEGTTHSGQDTVTIEYTYTLENDGQRLTVVARVTGTMGAHSIIPVEALLLTDGTPWRIRDTEPYRVGLDNGYGGTAEVELSVEYLAPNHYTIDAWFRDDAGSPCLEEDRDLDSGEEDVVFIL